MKRAAERLEAFLGRSAEVLAALLVVAETVILFSGVAARYVFHAPLVWSDELASILFIWLAMLGAAVAPRIPRGARPDGAVAVPRRRAAVRVRVRGRRADHHHPCARDLERVSRRRAAGGIRSHGDRGGAEI